MISQLGILPFGTTGPYSLPGKITVRAVLATAQNRVLVCWDVPPNVRDPKGTRSATNVGNYTITAIDPTIDTNNGPVVPLGEFVPSFEVAFWRAEVDEIDLERVHVGDTLTVVFDCYPQEEVSGTVQSISLIGNAKQNATYYDVTLSISASWQVLPGMNATVWLPAGQ